MMKRLPFSVHALPRDLPADRARTLLDRYRRLRDLSAPNAPPRWYTRALIAQLEARIARSAVAS